MSCQCDLLERHGAFGLGNGLGWLLCCLERWVSASVEELEGWSMLACVRLLELGSLLLLEAIVVFP